MHEYRKPNTNTKVRIVRKSEGKNVKGVWKGDIKASNDYKLCANGNFMENGHVIGRYNVNFSTATISLSVKTDQIIEGKIIEDGSVILWEENQKYNRWCKVCTCKTTAFRLGYVKDDVNEKSWVMGELPESCSFQTNYDYYLLIWR